MMEQWKPVENPPRCSHHWRTIRYVPWYLSLISALDRFFKWYFQTHYYIMKDDLKKKVQLKKRTSWFQTLVVNVYKVCLLSQSEIRNLWQFRWLFRDNTYILMTVIHCRVSPFSMFYGCLVFQAWRNIYPYLDLVSRQIFSTYVNQGCTRLRPPHRAGMSPFIFSAGPAFRVFNCRAMICSEITYQVAY